LEQLERISAEAVAAWTVAGVTSGEPAEIVLPLAEGQYGQAAFLLGPDGPWLRLGGTPTTTEAGRGIQVQSYFGPGTYGLLQWPTQVALGRRGEEWLSADGGLSLTLAEGQAASVAVVGIPSLPQLWRPAGPAYRIELEGYVGSLSLRPAGRPSALGTAILVLGPDGQWAELPSSLGQAGWRTMLKVGTATLALAEHPERAQGTASWYRFRGCDCAASRDYPRGTLLEVARADVPQRRVTVKVNDYGPEAWTGRVIDLDAVAFKKLGSTRLGLLTVTVKPVKLTSHGQVQ
jgi:hypothetical protein